VTDTVRSTDRYEKQRAVPRYSFVATIELTDPVHAIRLTGRVTEISRYGCYVDTLNTFPVGTLLHLEISCDQGKFNTKARIVYIHAGIGMGIAFTDTAENQMRVLESWLSALPATAEI